MKTPQIALVALVFAGVGMQIGNMHRPGATVAFNVDGGAKGGEFELILGYGSLKGARLSLTVNGETRSVSLPKTGGWQAYKAVRLSLTLEPGTANEIETKCPGANLDYFDLKEKQ